MTHTTIGSQLGKLKRHTIFVLAIIAISYGIGLASAIIMQDIWLAITVVAVGGASWILIGHYLTRHHKRRRPQYPLVPPEARPDMYLPRTDIPRPIYQDSRTMEEKKRKIEKLRKMTRKKKT
jgi:hypothetical protein